MSCSLITDESKNKCWCRFTFFSRVTDKILLPHPGTRLCDHFDKIGQRKWWVLYRVYNTRRTWCVKLSEQGVDVRLTCTASHPPCTRRRSGGCCGWRAAGGHRCSPARSPLGTPRPGFARPWATSHSTSTSGGQAARQWHGYTVSLISLTIYISLSRDIYPSYNICLALLQYLSLSHSLSILQYLSLSYNIYLSHNIFLSLTLSLSLSHGLTPINWHPPMWLITPLNINQ